MTRGLEAPKTSPEVVASRTYDALEAGTEEALADEITKQVKQGLSAEPGVYLVTGAFLKLRPALGTPGGPLKNGRAQSLEAPPSRWLRPPPSFPNEASNR